jgi:hypothetical protein
MKYSLIILTILISSCNTFIDYEREEQDVYVISTEDSTYINYNPKDPRNNDRGTLFPSDRVIVTQRKINSYDSVVNRTYPNFIRLGLLETAGFLTSGNSDNSIAGGPLGVHLNPSLGDTYRGNPGNTFMGAMYRVGIMEKRLRWFNDAPNWTWGFHAFEMLLPDARVEESLMGITPFYLRKRWFLDDKIPYQALTLHLGFGWLGLLSETLGSGFGGSGYVNIAGSYDFGSIGGFNARAYLGIAAGYNGSSNPLILGNEYLIDDITKEQTTTSTSPVFIYGGLGISLLDFLNTVEETKEEFKDMKHSAWDIGFLQIAGINAFTDRSLFLSNEQIEKGETDNQLVTGLNIKLINTSIGLPFFDKHFWVGTSLLNIFYAGGIEGGVGILPLRMGYWLPILKDELSMDPFFEYNYYPSSFVHLGARISLVIPAFRNHQFGIQFGYANGNALSSFINDDIAGGLLENYTTINNFYIGFYFGLWDRIFYEKELRYFKD